jgi:hypothetical protein
MRHPQRILLPSRSIISQGKVLDEMPTFHATRPLRAILGFLAAADTGRMFEDLDSVLVGYRVRCGAVLTQSLGSLSGGDRRCVGSLS